MTSKQRQKGTGSLFQRKRDGMWVGTIDLGYGPNGKRRRKTVSSKSRATTLKRLAEAKRQYDTTGDVPIGGQTVKAWMEYWVDTIAAKRVRPRTLDTYRGHVAQYVVPAIGRVRLDKLGPQHVRQLHSYVTDRGLSSTTARHTHVTLVKALADAQREGHVTRNAATLVDAPRRAAVDEPYLTNAQAIQFLLSLKDNPLASRWAMALFTGQRQGECLGLEAERVLDDRLDISWQLQRLAFEHGCGGTCGKKRGGNCPQRLHRFNPDFEHRPTATAGLFLTRPKTRSSIKVVPLVEPLRSVILGHLNGRTTGLVWSQPDGAPIDSKEDNHAWHAALEAAGLPSVKLHSARHTAATMFLEAGVDAKTVQQILGHSSALTSRAYQHVSLALATDAMKALGAALSGGAAPSA